MIIKTFDDLRLELESKQGTLLLAPVAEEVYRAHGALSQSELKVVAEKSPLHLRHQRMKLRSPTDSMKLGTAVHKMILEPESFESCYAFAPECYKRSKEEKAIWAAAQAAADSSHKKLITKDDYDTAVAMRDSLFSNIELRGLLRDGVAERACFGNLLGVHAKALLDYYRPQHHEIVDLKSTKCASLKQFERDVRNYRYHWQAAWYVDLVKTITGEEPTFKIVAVENVEPYCSAVFEINFDLLAIARWEIQQTVDTIKRCMDTGIWPGYPSAVNQLGAYKSEWEAYKKAVKESA